MKNHFFITFINMLFLSTQGVSYKFEVNGEIATPDGEAQLVQLSCHKSCEEIYTVRIDGKERPLHLHVTVQKKRLPNYMVGRKFLAGIDDHPSLRQWLVTINADTGDNTTYLNEAHFAEKGIIGTGNQKTFSGDLTYWTRAKGGKEIPSDKGNIRLTITHRGE